MPARRKRIALLIGPAAAGGAGFGTYARSLIPHLLARPDAGAFEFCLVGADERPWIEIAGCPYLRIVNPLPLTKTYSWYLQAAVRLRRHRFDLVHNLFGWPTFFGFAAKYVVTVHDLIAMRMARQTPIANVVVTGACLPRTLAHADRIVVPSRFTGDDVRARFPGLAAGHVTVTPLGIKEIFHDRPDPDGAAVREAYGLRGPFVDGPGAEGAAHKPGEEQRGSLPLGENGGGHARGLSPALGRHAVTSAPPCATAGVRVAVDPRVKPRLTRASRAAVDPGLA